MIFNIIKVYSPTNALFIIFETALKCTLKFKDFKAVSNLIKSAFVGE